VLSISVLLVIIGSVPAAAGQIFLKLGATGANSLVDFMNSRIATGFVLYAIGSVLWIIALSRLPLSKVYPFTILTFVLVYVASATLLGEPITITVLLGAALVIAGLMIITLA